jgi:hypothetical protein
MNLLSCVIIAGRLPFLETSRQLWCPLHTPVYWSLHHFSNSGDQDPWLALTCSVHHKASSVYWISSWSFRGVESWDIYSQHCYSLQSCVVAKSLTFLLIAMSNPCNIPYNLLLINHVIIQHCSVRVTDSIAKQPTNKNTGGMEYWNEVSDWQERDTCIQQSTFFKEDLNANPQKCFCLLALFCFRLRVMKVRMCHNASELIITLMFKLLSELQFTHQQFQ